MHFNPLADENIDIGLRIYHYTSPQGLHSILQSSSLRFTDCQFLNDKSEYIYIKEPLINAYEEIKASLQYDFVSPVIASLKDSFETLVLKATQSGASVILNLATKKYYVFCCSTIQDSLGMWNYYVKDGNYQGYNIGFTVKQLLDCFLSIDEPDVFYGRVIYDAREQINFLKDLILDTNQELTERVEQYGKPEQFKDEAKNHLLSHLERCRLFFKNECFVNEEEYRFIIRLPDDYTTKENGRISTGFDTRNGIITPYCQIKINNNTIDSITLSPMLDRELAEQGLKRCLSSAGYSKIPISLSKVPVRY